MSGDFQNRLRKNLGHEAPAEHPAPDALNAYAEQVLPTDEAKAVTEHLSVCAECREAVYLASAAAEEPAAEVIRPASHGVRWWSWAIPLAAVLVIGTTVMLSRLDHPKQTETYLQAKREAAPAQTAAPESTVAGKTKFEEKAVPAVKKKENKIVRQVPRAPEPQVARENGSAKTMVLGGVTAGARDQDDMIALAPNRTDELRDKLAKAPTAQAPAPAAAPSFAPQAANETVVVTAAAPVLEANNNTKELPKDAAARAADSPAYAVRSDLYRARKATVSTAWRVAGNFELQHSMNGQWQTVILEPGAKILTVSSLGNDVWAAGKNLALFHSGDGGATWSHENIVGAKAGDILHIEFSSATNGVLKTSAGQAFTTQDGGNTWIGLNSTPSP